MKTIDRILMERADEQTEIERVRAEVGRHDRGRLVPTGGYLPIYAERPVRRRSPCLGGCGRKVYRVGRGYCPSCLGRVTVGGAVDSFLVPSPQECARAKATEPGGWFGIQRSGNSRRVARKLY